ncbi:DUF7507 domain-containing protein [Dorea sp. AF36-15AT]|uniref:DUF7507 domain-containing protein n=1 Tax=Dorea sp. AF36-15AT TaxID=2292041 RepID=UPI0013143BFB|nr:Ig-like domain-containing protein [Dorea sp. AF36-15AT]
MKKMKRWLALVLAIALVSTNAIYQLGTHMSASESSQDTSVSEEQPQQEEQAVDSQTQDTTEHTDSGQASVQEVTPEQSATATTQQAPDAQQATDPQQTEKAQADVAKTIAVKIQKSDVDGGTVKVVNADGSKTDVTYDGNNQYAKEVTEGESFGFEVTAKDGYQVEQVTDQNGAAIQPASVNGNVSTYNVTDIRSEKVFSVTYNKVETQTEEKNGEKNGDDSSASKDAEVTVVPEEKTGEDNNESTSVKEEAEKKSDENVVEAEPVEDTKEDSSLLDKFKGWFAGESTKTVSEQNTVTVGQTIKLNGTSNSSWYCNYSQEWKSKDTNIATVSNDGTVTGVSAGKVTISHKYCTASHVYNRKHDTETEKYEVTVVAAPKPTGISISGNSSVERFKSIDLKATLEPAGANADIIWTSSNEEIAEVDDGTVKGVTAGEVTITATTDVDGKKLSATKKVTVTEAKKTHTALLYYLKTPTSDPKSNDTDQWGSQAGTCEISTNGLAWDSAGKNSFDNVASRVLKWPDGSTGSSWEITKSYDGGTHWNAIFNAFKAATSAEVGRNITEDDVEAIIIHPYKISNNNDGMHVDCTVEVKVKGIITATYYLYDAGNDATGFTWLEAKQYRLENGEIAVAAPTTNCPDTKTVDGKDYVFDGWYAGSYGSGEKINYPDTVSENINYYAKYVRANLGYTVKYYLNGTETPVATDKTGTAKRDGATVTENPISIAGYTAVSTDSKSIRVQENGTNEIIFYYYKNVELTANNASQKYNGTEYQVSGYSGAPEDADFSNITVSAKGTDAGEYDAKFAKNVVGTIDATGKYIVTNTTDGKLTITPRNVTLTSGSDKKEYDGTALTKDGVTVGGDGFVRDDGATYAVTGTITNVGEKDNTFTYKLKTGTKGSNYEITTVPGKLKITPCTTKITVTITENSGSEKYDGTEKTVTGYTVTSISNKLYKESDFSFTGVEAHKTVSGTNAGSYDMGLVSTDFTNNNDNFANVEFKIVDGKLDIAQRKVTLTSGTDSKTYDGKPLTKDGVAVSGDGFVKGEEPTYNVTGTITDAGTVDNTFTYTFAEGVVKENYAITKEEGTLTVAPIDKVVVTITGKKDRTTYNGKEQNVKDYEVSISNAKYKEKDFEFTGKAIAKGTDAGTYKMGLKASDFKNTNKNFKNVEFEVTDGELTIDPKEVTLTSGRSERVYNGTALTNKNVAESDNGFVGNDGATYEVTGSQTNVGESENTFTYKLKDGTKAKNYRITTEYGKLKVTPVNDEVTVTITENSDTAKYDGTEKNVTGYKVTSISNPAYTESDFAFTGDEAHKTVSGTNAGTYDMNLVAGDFANTSDNFTNVKFVIEDGTLVIAKRAVTLTSATAEKPYDGQPLENHKVTVGGDGFATGEGAASYNVTGSQTVAGESDNTFEGYTLNENTLADNYTITTAAGKLKVTPVTDKVTVTVKEHSGSGTYDGTEKTVAGYDIVSISNPLYTENDFTFSGEATVKGTDAGTYNMELKPEDFTNKSANFTNVEFVIEDGTLVIAKKTVTLTSASDSKPYDGNALTNDKVTAEGFVGNDGATYNVTGTITDVGEKVNEFTYTLNEGTNKDNYEITTVFGKLVITPNADQVVVTIKENSETVTYDGEEHTVTGYTVTNISSTLYTENDFEFVGADTAKEVKGTNAGTYDMNLKASDFQNKNEQFSNVKFVIVDGKLNISKRSVTLTSASASRPYNGKALTNNTVTVSGEGFANGEGAKYDVTGTITNVGKVDNTFTYNLNEGTNKDNYEITKNTGKLEITSVTTEVTVTITGNIKTDTYDGTEKTAKGYEVSIDNELYTKQDFSFDGEAIAKRTNAGTTMMGLKESNFANASKNFTNVKFVVIDGKVAIDKRNVTLTSATDSKQYDGKPLAKKEVTVGGDGFAGMEGATYDVTGSQTKVGSSNNTFIYVLNKNTNADNYNITTHEGTLTVTNRDAKYNVTLVANSNTGNIYDGSEKSATGIQTDEFEIDGVKYKVSGYQTSDPTATDAGTYDNVITGTYKVMDPEGNDVTDQFAVATQNGKLEIAKRKVTLTSATDSKQYDGTPLTKKEVTVTGDGFATGEGATYNVTGSQTAVGSSKNTFSYKLNDNTKADNYEIKEELGTLTVNDRAVKYEITVAANSDTVLYDGNEHTVEGLKENTFTLDGVKYTVSGLTAKATGTDVDEYTSEIKGTAVVTDEAGNDVTKQFIVHKTDGKLIINQRKVTLTSASDEKKYDGKPLTNGEITVGGDGFATGEGASYDVTGSQTIVGSSDNEFTYTLNANTKAKNYNITTHKGTLTVTNRDAKYEITVEANSATAPYDGQPHSATGLKTDTFVVNGETYTVSGLAAEVTATDADEYANTVTGTAVVKDVAGNDVTAQFEVHTKNGKLTITKRTVIFTSATDSKPYDGKPLTNHEVTVTGDGFAEGEGASFNVTGSRTLAGKSDNTYEYTLNSNTNAKNYNITKNTGTLTITDRETKYDITVRANSKDTTYDGTEQTVVGFEQTTFVVDGNTYTVSGISAEAKGTDQGNYQTTITGTPVVKDTSGNDVTSQFEVKTVSGLLKIAKRDITITAGSAQAIYTGTALICNTSQITAGKLATGDNYTATIAGSQTLVGSSDNIITSVTIKADKDGQEKDVTNNYNIKLEPGLLTITDGAPETPVDPSVVVNKTHDENQTYKAGDVITFTITVKNIYDEVKTITLAEQEGVTLDSEVFENVEPGKEITATATYTVTEADIVNRTFTNNVTARFSGVDKEYTGTDTVDEFENPNPHMTITKTTKDVEENHIYKLGETIKYVITVTNDGNLTLTNVKVEDALTGNAGQNAWTIDTFAPGATQTFETSYVVTEEDVLAGKVINNVTGTAKDPTNPDEPKTPVTPGEKEDSVETPNPSLTVVKTSDKTGQVKLGDEITYTITVTNNGNVTISGVKLNDSLTGDNWTLGNIKPGETVTKKATYTVTEADIIEGQIVNHATATGKDPSGNDVTGKGEKTVTTEESNPHITVTKETTSRPKNGETYALGEEITYKITAKNTGNLTLKDVKVIDELTGLEKTIKGEFKPGDEETFETSYTVTEADLGKTVVNVATATGKTPDSNKPKPGVDPGKTEDPTDQKKPAMSIEKKVIDQKEKYEIGDTVKYEITVTNTGNTTQNNILVEDQMSAAGQAVITKVDGANGTIDGAKVTLDTLAPGKAATITAEYTVVKADRGNTITNAAVAKGEGEIPKTPDVPVDVEDVYDIHVVHAFASGNEGDVTLPADYTIENLKPGTTKDLIAEAVTGYVAYPGTQNATIIDGDITVTFLYYKDEIGTDPKNPDQPDGVPDEFQRVVRFAAVNGTVSIDHAVVTLYGEDGKPAKNGVGHLSAEQIAAATANTGYDQSSLSWSPATPTSSYDITDEMTFTATFTATPAVPNTPNTPTPPATPNPPATPSDNPGVLDRVVDTIKDVAADVQEVFSSDDGDVPLANQNLDEHKCCILHFLIMLLTAILYGFFTHNMKKRQKKNFELREELDTELVKRGLPTSKEQKNS